MIGPAAPRGTVSRVLVVGTLVLVCVATLAIGSARPAGACSCEVPTDQQALGRADAAFTGALVDVVAPTEALVSSADPERFVFEVDEVFKGPVTARQTVVTPRGGESCGLEISGPGPHLVFAFEDSGLTSGAEEGELYSHLCSGTRLLADAAVPDSFMGSPPAPGGRTPPGSATESASTRPDGGATTPWVPLAIGAGALLLVVAAVWRRRARP